MNKLLEQIGPLVNESEYKSRMRLHQGWWRTFVLGEKTGKHPSKDEDIRSTIKHGERNKKNFISNMVSNVVNEVLNKRKSDEIVGLINEDRLYNNLLSSQPLCFNFFVPLYRDNKLALGFLRQYYPEITKVNEVYFEHANPKNKFDNSAFDVAFDVNDGNKKGIIGFECKYTDSFSSKVYQKPSYESIYSGSGIFAKSY